MVVPFRDTGNITFYILTLQTTTSNIALEFDIDMAGRSTVNNIIFSDSGRKKQVRDHSLTSSNSRNRSITPLIEPDFGNESYYDKV